VEEPETASAILARASESFRRYSGPSASFASLGSSAASAFQQPFYCNANFIGHCMEAFVRARVGSRQSRELCRNMSTFSVEKRKLTVTHRPLASILEIF
jgi:hypothetical protein